jgi:hypothetical protein
VISHSFLLSQNKHPPDFATDHSTSPMKRIFFFAYAKAPAKDIVAQRRSSPNAPPTNGSMIRFNRVQLGHLLACLLVFVTAMLVTFSTGAAVPCGYDLVRSNITHRSWLDWTILYRLNLVQRHTLELQSRPRWRLSVPSAVDMGCLSYGLACQLSVKTEDEWRTANLAQLPSSESPVAAAAAAVALESITRHEESNAWFRARLACLHHTACRAVILGPDFRLAHPYPACAWQETPEYARCVLQEHELQVRVISPHGSTKDNHSVPRYNVEDSFLRRIVRPPSATASYTPMYEFREWLSLIPSLSPRTFFRHSSYPAHIVRWRSWNPGDLYFQLELYAPEACFDAYGVCVRSVRASSEDTLQTMCNDLGLTPVEGLFLTRNGSTTTYERYPQLVESDSDSAVQWPPGSAGFSLDWPLLSLQMHAPCQLYAARKLVPLLQIVNATRSPRSMYAGSRE